EENYRQIYDLYKYRIYQYIYNLISNKEEAHDITSDCFLKLWNKKEGFDDLNKIKSFLFTTAYNACIDFLRRSQVQLKSQKELAFLAEKNENLILAQIVKAELLGEVYAEIQNLPSECRQIFKMLYFQGMDYTQIAESLNIQKATVRSQKRRALN